MSCRNALACDVLGGLVAHIWFNKHEPEVSWSLFTIIALAPAPSAWLLCDHISALQAIPLAYVVFLTTLFTSISIYRISPFHPLAEYPGPLLCKLTQFWNVWMMWGGKQHIYRLWLHQTYGPIVRIGPNELSIVDKELLPSILGPQGMPKGPLNADKRLTPASEKHKDDYSLQGCRDSQRHAKLRKAWSKAFTNSPIKDYEELMLQRALQLIDIFDKFCRERPDGIGRVDISKWINFFSYDFMGDLIFGGVFELMRDGDKDGLWHSMETAIIYPAMCQHIPWFSPILRVLPFVGAPMRAFAKFALHHSTIRSTKEVKRKDLFYHITEATLSDIDSGISAFPLIVSNAVLAITAGSDTVASSLSGIMYYILANPADYARLKQEVDETFPPNELNPVNSEVFARMPFLHAVVREGLRLQPAVPSSIQRAPEVGTGGKLVGSHYFKEGTMVTVAPYAQHRDPRYFWPDPDKYWPERWIKTSGNAITEDGIICDRGAFIPFSYGPANCVAKPLAMIELQTAVLLFVMHFDMEFDDGFNPASWENNLQDFFSMQKGELMTKLKPRQRVRF
ncbi:high nitrogen upregulated cytochrome P450 monooxygenase 2 [Leucogyrophana mollusca]|uniref:High nitrogen upregulated cytochrome P450 monooxygenase 2 n=1 Tax=Leucogyrophana mollusca TaxID=85980 RepID=A0ACB8C1I2_9AGAM|nr:high nitrogen upregulated cytochrome P450 monooxygenase 2 [Leucogyrophana mollusca]